MNRDTAMSLDVSYVRSRFPGLNDGWVYFDNAGGSQVLDVVIERISDYLRTSPVQLGATYEVSQLGAHRQKQAADAMAAFVNARETREIVFGPSASALLGRLSRALAPNLDPGDEIIVTNLDHEANITPWRQLTERGVIVKTWRVRSECCDLALEDLRTLLSERTRLVCVTHASNIAGSILPIADIARLAHEAGAEICVDGVACVAHRAIDVQALDVDYYVFSAYKVYGPHIGILYGKYDALLRLANVNHEFFAAEDVPLKLQPGAAPYELVYGVTGIADYYRELGQQAGANTDMPLQDCLRHVEPAFAAHEQELMVPLLSFLADKPRVRIIGESAAGADRLPTVSFVIGDRDSATVPPHLDNHKIAIRYGHFYAKRLIDDLGLAPQNGVVRVSMAHYNTVDEVARLIEVLESVMRD